MTAPDDLPDRLDEWAESMIDAPLDMWRLDVRAAAAELRGLRADLDNAYRLIGILLNRQGGRTRITDKEIVEAEVVTLRSHITDSDPWVTTVEVVRGEDAAAGE